MSLPNIIEGGRYAILDLETTGLSTKKDEPVQIAFALVDFGITKLRGYYTLKPSVPVKYGAMQKHGFSEANLAFSPSFTDIAEELYHLIGDRTVLGYGCKKFDVPILARMFRTTLAEWAPEVLDVLLWDRHFRPGKGVSHKLVDAVIHWNVPRQAFHDAWHDCRMTWGVLGALATHHPAFGALRPYDAICIQDDDFTWENYSQAEQATEPCAWCAEKHAGGPENCQA